MITLTRLAFTLACAFGAAKSIACAQVRPAGSRNGSAAAEIEAYLSALPNWSTSTAVTASYGYKDNLLLSFASEERSPFVRGSVELLLLRIPQDQFDFSFFAEAGGTRYTAGRTVEDDAKVWVQAEPGYRVGETLKFALPVTGYYYDQVFDVSDTEVERLVAELKVTGVMAGPLVRWDFHPAWWIEAQGVAQRKRYDDRANNGDIGEGAVRLGWARGGWFEARVSGAQRWRDFDFRSQYSAAGRELAGTALKISEREGELRFDVTWDQAARWQTCTRASVLAYRDNGSGYFNYREQKVAHELEWNVETWQVRIGGSASRVDFDVQTVGLGIDPPARLRDEFIGELHVGRKLNNRWTIFGGYTWERSRSNDPVASYQVNEGLLGMRWSWEK
ncbi:MAG: hypothetical protein ACREH8_05515 [Opitutaceae bacterium]